LVDGAASVCRIASTKNSKSLTLYSTRRPIRTQGKGPRGALNAHKVLSLNLSHAAASREIIRGEVGVSLGIGHLLSPEIQVAFNFLISLAESSGGFGEAQ
jgi:hypothetical protein